MSLNKKQRILVYIVSGLIVLAVIGIIIINVILGNIIESKIKDALKDKATSGYSIELRKVNANILTGNINLKDLKIVPDSLFIEQIKNGESDKSTAFDVHVGTFRLAGIGVLKAISERDIRLDKILFKKAKFKLYLGKKSEQHTEKPDSKINLDSIYIKALDGLHIGDIDFQKCHFEIYDLEKDRIVISNDDLQVDIHEISLQKLEGGNNYFKLHYENVELTIENEKITLPDGNYYLSLERIYFNLSESLLELDNLVFKPTYEDRYVLAKKLVYTSEIFDVTAKKISVLGINIDKLVGNGQYFIDSIKIDGLDLNILMDKRLPFNVDKRPKLLNEAIKNAGIPIYIHHIDIANSRLNYQERMPKTTDLMTAILGDLDVQVSFATSLEDSIATGKSMVVNLRSHFMNLTPLWVDFDFPLISRIDTFYYAGHLASAQMNKFNQAAYPAMGIKFIKGQLDDISFSGSASPRFSKGEMTMLYHDLEAEVSKKDLLNTSKFLSWVANAMLYTSNPGKNTDVRIVQMDFERVPYKGFGNVVWKTLQSGIINTVLPTGKTIDTKKIPESRKDKRENRRNRK